MNKDSPWLQVLSNIVSLVDIIYPQGFSLFEKQIFIFARIIAIFLEYEQAPSLSFPVSPRYLSFLCRTSQVQNSFKISF